MNSNLDVTAEFQTIPLQHQQNKKIFPKANPQFNNSSMNDIEEFSPNEGRREDGGRRKEEGGRKREEGRRREEEEKRGEEYGWREEDGRMREGDTRRREEGERKKEEEGRRREEEVKKREEEERKSLRKSIFGNTQNESKILKEQFSNSILDGDARLSVKRENSSTILSDFEVLQRKYVVPGVKRRNIENINLTFCLECQNFLEIDNTNLHILFCRKKTTKKPKNRIFNSRTSASKENLLKTLDNLDKLIFTKPSYPSFQPSSQPSSQPSFQPSSQPSSQPFSKPPLNKSSSGKPSSSLIQSSSLLQPSTFFFPPDGEYLKVLEGILIGILERIKENGGSLEMVGDLDRLKNCYMTQEKGVGQRYLLVISRVKEIVEGDLQGKEGEWGGEF